MIFSVFYDFYDFCEISVPGIRVLLAAGDAEQHLWRSQELRGSPELQNGGLRALEEAVWTPKSTENHQT